MMDRVLRALRLLISGGEVLRTDWDRPVPTAQLATFAGAPVDRVPIFGPFGLAYRPPAGSRVLTAAIGSDRSQITILGAAHPDVPLPDLAEGESALYARGGAVLRLGVDGRVHVTGDVVVDGNAEISGDVIDRVGALDRLRNIFNAHTHVASGSPTTPPVTPDI